MNNKKWLIASLALILIILTVGILFYFYKDLFFKSDKKEISQENFDLVKELGVANQEGDYQKEIEISQKLVDQKIDTKLFSEIDAKVALANAYLDEGSIGFKEEEGANKAIEIANQILSMDQNNYKAYDILGYAYEIKEDYKNAILNYDKSIEINSQNADSYANRGHSYELSGDLVKAKSNYQQALKINPQHCGASMHMARVSFMEKDFESVESYSNNVLSICQKAFYKSTVLGLLGDMNIINKKYDAAEDNLKNAIGFYQKDSKIYADLAWIYAYKIENKNYINSSELATLQKSFQDNINTALEINPNSAHNHAVLAYYYSFEPNKDLKMSLENYQKAYDLVDKDITISLGKKEAFKKYIKSLINDLK